MTTTTNDFKYKRGIDISEHQGDIDLTTLKAHSKLDFVIIRVGYGVSGTIDKKFKRNADLCKELGIPMGFYWYSYALDTTGAKKEAQHFLNAIAPYTPEYGCWFDMEDADGYKKRKGMPSNDVLKTMCYVWCETVEEAGYYAGVYASESWFKNQLSGSKLDRFDKWIAQWPTSGGSQKGLNVDPQSKKGVSMWQFTSAGKLKGYNGSLDVNYAYKTFPCAKSQSQSQTITSTATPDTNTSSATPDTSTTTDKKVITKGSKVMFTGTRSYLGVRLAEWTNGAIFNVIEIVGNRVVIGKGTAVTAAVKAEDCKLI